MQKLWEILSKPAVKAIWIWGLICLLLGGLFDFFVMPWLTGSFKETVSVPDLKGKTPDEAKDELSRLDLTLIIDSAAEFSQDIDAGNIMKQRPLPEAKVKEGRRVWATVSKGLKQITLPEFKGQSIRQCEITLQQMGLELGEIRWRKSRNIPMGVVYKSEPKSGEVIEANTSVVLYASSGMALKKDSAPRLIGLSLAKAKRIMATWGLKLKKVEYKKDSKQLPKTVLSQTPAPGFSLDKEKSIHLIVSKE